MGDEGEVWDATPFKPSRSDPQTPTPIHRRLTFTSSPYRLQPCSMYSYFSLFFLWIRVMSHDPPWPSTILNCFSIRSVMNLVTNSFGTTNLYLGAEELAGRHCREGGRVCGGVPDLGR